MCWHELKKFCCCFSIKTGVYVAILVNIAVSSVGIIIGHYYLKAMERDPYKAVTFDAEKNRVTVISIILGVDILFTLFLFISAAFDLLCPAVPWVVKQLIATVFLLGLSLAVAIRHWSTFYFYLSFLLVAIAFVYLYFWVVVISFLKSLGRKDAQAAILDLNAPGSRPAQPPPAEVAEDDAAVVEVARELQSVSNLSVIDEVGEKLRG